MGVNGSNTKGFAPICGNNGVAVTTTGTEIELDCSSVTTGKAMQIDCDGLTTGTALEIRVDSDVVTTGKAINVLSGSTMSTSVFSVDEDGDVVAAGSQTFATDKKLVFRDSGIYINSGADGKISIVADGSGADDITLSGSVSASDNIRLATDKKVEFRDSGIYIQSGADGKLTIASDGTGADDITLSGSVTFGSTVTLDSTTLTVTGSELNALDGNAQNATFTVGGETSNTITIAVQINDGASSPAAIAKRQGLFWYLSSDSTGDTLATAPTGGIAAGTDGTLIETLDNQAGYVITEADGDADFVLTDSGTNDFYLNIVMPNGDIKTSAVASFST